MLQATAVATPGLLNIYPVSEGKPYEYIPEKNKKKWDEVLVSSPREVTAGHPGFHQICQHNHRDFPDDSLGQCSL